MYLGDGNVVLVGGVQVDVAEHQVLVHRSAGQVGLTRIRHQR